MKKEQLIFNTPTQLNPSYFISDKNDLRGTWVLQRNVLSTKNIPFMQDDWIIKA